MVVLSKLVAVISSVSVRVCVPYFGFVEGLTDGIPMRLLNRNARDDKSRRIHGRYMRLEVGLNSSLKR